MNLCCSSGSGNGKWWIVGSALAAVVILGVTVLLTDNNGDNSTNAAAFIVLLGANAGVLASRRKGKTGCCSDGLTECTLGESDPDDAGEVREIFEDRRG